MQVVDIGCRVAVDVNGSDLRHSRQGSQDVNPIADSSRHIVHAVERFGLPRNSHRLEGWKTSVVATDFVAQPPAHYVNLALRIADGEFGH